MNVLQQAPNPVDQMSQQAVNAEFHALTDGLNAEMQASQAPVFDPAMLAMFMRSANNPELARVLAGALAFDVAMQQYNHQAARYASGESQNTYHALMDAGKEDKE